MRVPQRAPEAGLDSATVAHARLLMSARRARRALAMGVIGLAGLLVSGPTAALAGSSTAVKPKTMARPAPSQTARGPVTGGRAVVGKAKPAPGRPVHLAFHSSPKRLVHPGSHSTTLAKATSEAQAAGGLPRPRRLEPTVVKPAPPRSDFVRPRV